MTKLDDQFIQDRALRDSARAVIMADITHAQTSLSAKGMANRVGGRIGDGAKDVFEVTKTHSQDKRGVVAALIGAVLIWLAREPIFEIFGLKPFDEDSDGDGGDGNDGGENEIDAGNDENTIAASPEEVSAPDHAPPSTTET